MKVFRWILVLPTFLLVCFLVHIAASFLGAVVPGGLGIEEAFQFMDRTDMGEHWFSGTFYLVWVRVQSFAAGTYAALKIAPSHQRQAGKVIFGGTLIFLVFPAVLFLLQEGGMESFSFWYRSFIDTAAIMGGVSFPLLKRSDFRIPSGR